MVRKVAQTVVAIVDRAETQESHGSGGTAAPPYSSRMMLRPVEHAVRDPCSAIDRR